MNPNISDRSSLGNISLKKIIFSIITLFTIIWQVVILNELGNFSSWGILNPELGKKIVINYVFFGIETNNVLFFFFFAFLGNMVILISSLNIIFGVNEKGANISFLNEKQLHLIGLIFYLIGIIGYFEFLVFEPFLFLYLISMSIIYYLAVTITISPLFQETYVAFNSSSIMDFSVWHPNTKSVITTYFTSGGEIIEIFLFLSVFLFFVQSYLIFSSQGKLLSESHSIKIQKYFKFERTLDTKIVKNKYFILGSLLLINYIFFLLTFVRPTTIIAFVFIFFYFPIFKKKIMNIEFFRPFGFLAIKLYDFYILNLILIILAGYALDRYSNYVIIVAFIIALWLSVKLIDLNISTTIKRVPKIHFNFDTLKNAIFLFIFTFYFNAWITSDPSESIYLLILVLYILLRSSPFLVRNFFNSGIIKYSLRRFAIIIPMFIGISMIVYGLMSLAGNPVDLLLNGNMCGLDVGCTARTKAILDERFGFNNPIHVQWANWLFRFFMGDMGQEIVIGSNPVTFSLVARILPTIEISFVPLLFSILISVPLGIKASQHQNTLLDNSILIFVAIGIAVPIFFFILVMIMLFSGILSILPSFGRRLEAQVENVNLVYAQWFDKGIPLEFNFIIEGKSIFNLVLGSPINLKEFVAWAKYDWMFHMIVPVVAITLLGLALYTRLVRGGMLEIMRNDYILSARASGFSEKVIINKHALRNVMIPVVTVIGLSIGSVLGGAPITETVTGWPGLGKYGLDGLLISDYSVIMATYMIVSAMTLTANLITDITYSVIDPRVRID